MSLRDAELCAVRLGVPVHRSKSEIRFGAPCGGQQSPKVSASKKTAGKLVAKVLRRAAEQRKGVIVER